MVLLVLLTDELCFFRQVTGIQYDSLEADTLILKDLH
jgi:hypothetical protein